ncbi:MAG: hypothetical protein P8Y97_23065 [Candidatus Lokiarchaeota archaeon]
MAFVPAVQAKAYNIPLERWWEDQWGYYATNPHLGGFMDPDNSLIVRPHTTGGEMIEDPEGDYWQWYYKALWDCDYDGYIHVRELNEKDGYDLMITVCIKCSDAPFVLIDINNFPFPIFKGEMKYISFHEFKIDLDLYPFQDEDGWYLPIWWMPIFGISTLDPRDDGIESVSSHFQGVGTGAFVDSWNGWESGDTAKVKVSQMGLVKFLYGEDDWGEHPNYYPPAEDYIFGELWPVEFIKVS